MNLLLHLLKRGKKWGPQCLHVHLCIKIIQWVTEKVVPINNIVFKTPIVTLWSDAFEYGIIEYNDKGMA